MVFDLRIIYLQEKIPKVLNEFEILLKQNGKLDKEKLLRIYLDFLNLYEEFIKEKFEPEPDFVRKRSGL